MDKAFNKKDLKKESRAFRTIASRTITSDFQMFDDNLKRLINYIDKDIIIKQYINSCIKNDDNFTIEDDVKSVSSGYGEYIFGNHIDEEKEVSYIYQILKYITENNVNCRTYIYPYSFSKQYQDKLKGFCDNFVQPLINYIDENYERIFIEMGYDEETNFNITINGGQVNIAKDNAMLTAIQNEGNLELNKLIENLKQTLNRNDIDNGIKNELIDNAEGIKEELNRKVPRKGILKSFAEGLKQSVSLVPEVLEIGANITAIISFLQPFL